MAIPCLLHLRLSTPAPGVRFNAEKKKIGMYYTTPIWSFRMKCPRCKNWWEIHTDPKVCMYSLAISLPARNLVGVYCLRGWSVRMRHHVAIRFVCLVVYWVQGWGKPPMGQSAENTQPDLFAVAFLCVWPFLYACELRGVKLCEYLDVPRILCDHFLPVTPRPGLTMATVMPLTIRCAPSWQYLLV
jgi:hypothetical protein